MNVGFLCINLKANMILIMYTKFKMHCLLPADANTDARACHVLVAHICTHAGTHACTAAAELNAIGK